MPSIVSQTYPKSIVSLVFGLFDTVLCIFIIVIISILIPKTPPCMAMGERPKKLDHNILIITIDTLRADHLGSYGYRYIKTPHIDKLASGGVVFYKTFTPIPITLPSHCCIMTGLYPQQHGVRNNGNFLLTEDYTTLAELMKGQGYKTGACIGSFVLDSIFGLDQGFDFYDDSFTPGKKRLNFLYNERRAEDVNKVAINWLSENKDERFFLWIHYFDPHSPYMPPVPFSIEYRNSLYDGEIAYTDACIGKLFKAMEEMGLMDHTIIVLAGDHGEGLGEHNELTHAIFIYDSTLWVPLIIHAPFLYEGGERIDAIVSTIDIMPTILDILGLRPVNDLAGKSLLPLIKGNRSEIRTQILCESICPEQNFGWSPLEAIRTTEWKYISAPIAELYDLKNDPGETENLLLQDSTVKGKWANALESLKGKYKTKSETSQMTRMDPETEQRLRSLGYVWTRAEADANTTGESVEMAGPDPKEKIHIMNYIDNGMGYLLMGKYDHAIEQFQRILKEDPDNMAAYFNLACSYEEKGEIDKAEDMFKKVLELNPQHGDTYNHLGLISYNRGKWEDALRKFQRALESFDYVEVYYNLSLTYNKLGKTEDAFVSIKKAIDLDPEYSEAWNQLGNLYMLTNNPAEAENVFKRAIELDPQNTSIHNNLGLIYSKMGSTDKAISEFHRAAELDPNSAEAHNNLGSLYIEKRKFDVAREELETALSLRPGYLKAIINLGLVYLNVNDLQRAEEFFTKALDIDADSAESLSQLGNLYILKEEYERALSLFQRVHTLQPDDPRAYYDLGKAYQALGNMDAAIGSWQKSLELQPGLPGAHLNIGNAYFSVGDLEKAQEEWEIALSNSHIDVPTHLLNLGMVYLQRKEYDMATLALQRAGDLKPGDLNIHYTLGIAYFQMALYDKAAQELRECLRIQSGLQNAQILLDRIKGMHVLENSQ